MRRHSLSPAAPAAVSPAVPLVPTVPRFGGVHWAVRWALYGFMFSLPFDAPNSPLPVELTSMTGAVFLAATLLQPLVCYGRISKAWWWFMIYLWTYGLAFALNGPLYSGQYKLPVVASFLFILQGVLIFWACANLMRDEEITKRMFLALVVGCAILSILALAGVITNIDPDSFKLQRATLLGQNPNRTARILGVALLALWGLMYGQARPLLRRPWIAWAVGALIFAGMLKGGSRGGLLALVMGVWTFAFTGRTLALKVRNLVVSVLAIGLMAAAALASPVMQRRIQLAESGNLAGRQMIFPAAYHMFLDRPLIGWGPVRNHIELATRLRLPTDVHASRDTHNLLLELLTQSGLLGTIPFCVGVWFCAWAALKARAGPYGMLPVALGIFTLAGNMSGNYIALKLTWIVFGFALAAAPLPPPVTTRTTGRLQRRRMVAGPVQ